MLSFLNCLRLGEQVTGIPEVPFLWCWNLLSSWFLLEPPWLPGMVSSAGRVLSHTLLGILTVSEICLPYFFFSLLQLPSNCPPLLKCVFICVHAQVCAPQHTCGAQRTACGHWFSPPKSGRSFCQALWRTPLPSEPSCQPYSPSPLPSAYGFLNAFIRDCNLLPPTLSMILSSFC